MLNLFKFGSPPNGPPTHLAPKINVDQPKTCASWLGQQIATISSHFPLPPPPPPSPFPSHFHLKAIPQPPSFPIYPIN